MKNLTMKTTAFLVALVFMATTFSGCKSGPKDDAIKAAVETALLSNPHISEAAVTVEKGVATVSGQVPDETIKAEIDKTVAKVEGVKSVVNNLIVVPDTPSVPVAATDVLTNAVKDATKDFPTVTATVNDGLITLKGEIEKANLQKLMMALNALKPKKIDNSQLTIK
ncbi:transport-associated protein [Pedobacter ginsengisoli]|uniref:Transport-associated protein n=1 Tax=Pedobacter ginsengisoli TaxID=363852 RepID=A0A2D1U2N3_9SPHI|nr:BON domain-containing protein [Pedobacter ginsengisoli]ATP55843.1 transport-associated protein [Pedobacter ginsengisoli]